MKSNCFTYTYLLTVIVLWMANPDTTSAQVVCSDSLLSAKSTYSLGFFDRAVHSLEPCWKDAGQLDITQHREILRIMAISYLYQDNQDSTHVMMRHLMRNVDRSYKSNPLEDPLLIQDLAQKYRIKWYEKRWVQLSGAAVAGGTAAYFIFRPQPEQLGEPPALPGPPQ